MAISMTGFGRSIFENDEIFVKVEIKSVNSRYTDINIKIPRNYSFIEEKIRKKIKTSISRGKVDAFFTINNKNSEDLKIEINNSIAEQYFASLTNINKKFNLDDKIRTYNIASYPGVLVESQKEIDQSDNVNSILETVEKALEKYNDMRIEEGNHIGEDLFKKINEFKAMVSEIEKYSDGLSIEHKKRIKTRLTTLLEDTELDENRFNQEIAMLADKVCVDEEITRLNSHIIKFENSISGNEIGRKLDFIVQEMNREVNTIGSKTNILDVTNIVLECKSLIEKLREQAMNLV